MMATHLTYQNFHGWWVNNYWKFQPLKVNRHFKILKKPYVGGCWETSIPTPSRPFVRLRVRKIVKSKMVNPRWRVKHRQWQPLAVDKSMLITPVGLVIVTQRTQYVRGLNEKFEERKSPVFALLFLQFRSNCFVHFEQHYLNIKMQQLIWDRQYTPHYVYLRK